MLLGLIKATSALVALDLINDDLATASNTSTNSKDILAGL